MNESDPATESQGSRIPPRGAVAVAAAQEPPPDRIAVRMRDVRKMFGPVVANQGASLTVATGEIHALVGENGAGKSTLMRILSGLLLPDAGRVEVHGRDITGWSAHDAIAAGVGMVHQHFMLVPTLTVAENIVLGMEPRTGPVVNRSRAVGDVQELAARTGLGVDPSARVEALSVGESQRVEILKVLYRGARILVLDEPTAVLSPPEVQELWQVLRTLRARGDTVILITHRLDEVLAVSDTVTVMRGGRTVARLATGDATPRDIARAMVGRDVSLVHETVSDFASRAAVRAPREVDRSVPVSLKVENLVVRGDRGTVAVRDLTFDIAPGEVLGVAGVEGNGQTELVEAIAGIRTIERGKIIMREHALHTMSVRQRAEEGLAHIPEDRHRRGLILDYSLEDNLVLGQHHRFTRWHGLSRRRIVRHAQELIREFDIRPAVHSLPVRALSGGNQQKVVVAREIGGKREFRVLLAAQPTRGIDVGATEFIHAQLRKARDDGKAVLLVSADLQEILALADRVAVMYGGRFVSVLPARDCSPEVLGPLMIGADA